jgi:hypothetical protein
MRDLDQAAGALATALDADPTFVTDPPRLGRALLDLSPYDRLTRLLVLAAEVGVPALTAAGALADARDVLRDDLGLRLEVARWVAEAWAAARVAVPADPSDRPARSGLLPDPGSAVPEGPARTAPGTPTVLRVGVGAGNRPLVAAVSHSGIFVTAPSGPGPVTWRRVATPTAPGSRDVALAPDPGGLVAYSSEEGVVARALSCMDAPATGSGIRLGEARVLVPTVGEQARYPLLAARPDDMSVELLWTADRRQLRRALLRAWLPGVTADAVPSPCGPQERLAGLHLARGDADPAWVLAVTDRGRLLVARWEIALESVGGWRPLDPPVPVATATIALLAGTPVVLAGTAAGHLISADARVAGSGSWHSVEAPADLPVPAPLRLLAATGGEETGWLVAGGDQPWLSPLRLVDDRVVAGPDGIVLSGL